MATQSHDDVPVRRLRARRDSAPVPTELVDSANPLAIAFHVSTSLAETDATTPNALGRYWGAGRRKAREAKDVLLARGLWFEVRVPQRDGGEWRGWDVEYRAVETRATDRDILELAMEYPVGTRISTAGGTWRVDDAGRPVPASGSTTEIGSAAGQGSETETGPRPSGSTTEIGSAAGQGSETETGPRPSGSTTEIGSAAGQGSETEIGPRPSGPLKEVNSFLPEGRKEGINEGDGDAPHSGAGDAALEDELISAVRDLVRRLPWTKAPVGRSPKILSEADQRLVPAVVAAIREHEFTLEAAQVHALERMDRVKSVDYLVKAFGSEHLSLADPEDVLALPAAPSGGKPEQRAAGEQQPRSEAPTWCGDCRPVKTEHGKTCSTECTTGQPSTDDGTGRAKAEAYLRERGPRAKARAAVRRRS